MTSYRAYSTEFHPQGLSDSEFKQIWLNHWPVVYLIHNNKEIYIGETSSTSRRFNQHVNDPAKNTMEKFDVIKSDKFNKSATLDLESFLIDRFFADEKYQVKNRNRGMPQEDYYNKKFYDSIFKEIFEELKQDGFFKNSLKEIENKDLFKLSPFKRLTEDQTEAALKIIENIIKCLRSSRNNTFIVEGNPGTGKTVIAIFLIKFIADLIESAEREDVDSYQMNDDFLAICTKNNLEVFRDISIGLVVPQGSLRDSIRKVFKKIPGLDPNMVLDPFGVGKSGQQYDLLIVDESHRLGQRSNQSSGVRNKEFSQINKNIFGEDDIKYTQLDWIKQRSKLQILMLDEKQSVKPGDIPLDMVKGLVNKAKRE